MRTQCVSCDPQELESVLPKSKDFYAYRAGASLGSPSELQDWRDEQPAALTTENLFLAETLAQLVLEKYQRSYLATHLRRKTMIKGTRKYFALVAMAVMVAVGLTPEKNLRC